MTPSTREYLEDLAFVSILVACLEAGIYLGRLWFGLA